MREELWKCDTQEMLGKKGGKTLGIKGSNNL